MVCLTLAAMIYMADAPLLPVSQVDTLSKAIELGDFIMSGVKTQVKTEVQNIALGLKLKRRMQCWLTSEVCYYL